MLKKFLVFSLVLAAAPAAFADGWVCQTAQGLRAAVYNHTAATVGTRSGAVMILSDETVQEGRKAIARFTDTHGTLGNSGATYVANVDLRFADSRRAGEYLAGTRLGYVDQVILDIDFSYAAPVAEGTTAEGDLIVVKRDGKRIVQSVECSRYLKK
jgi:hypothetical protein